MKHNGFNLSNCNLVYALFKVFSSIPDNLSLRESQELEGKIEEVCWLVCRKNYLKREFSHFSDATVYQLFRIFCFLSDLVPVPTSDNFQVRLFFFLVKELKVFIVIVFFFKFKGINAHK